MLYACLFSVAIAPVAYVEYFTAGAITGAIESTVLIVEDVTTLAIMCATEYVLISFGVVLTAVPIRMSYDIPRKQICRSVNFK